MADCPYLLIHGLIGSLRELAPLFAAHGRQALAPDLLGYGSRQDAEPSSITLDGQVAHLAQWLSQRGIRRVHLVGHSVGGAIAMLFAAAYPHQVASIINVEGNFTLDDAFWSANVATMPPREAEALLAGFQQDPAQWLARSAISASPRHLDSAARLLANQPASTLQATARSVVAVTGRAAYLEAIRALFEGPIAIHLIAGEGSKDGWHVPEWARAHAASVTYLPGGHLMMLEDPQRFVAALISLPG